MGKCQGQPDPISISCLESGAWLFGPSPPGSKSAISLTWPAVATGTSLEQAWGKRKDFSLQRRWRIIRKLNKKDKSPTQRYLERSSGKVSLSTRENGGAGRGWAGEQRGREANIVKKKKKGKHVVLGALPSKGRVFRAMPSQEAHWRGGGCL